VLGKDLATDHSAPSEPVPGVPILIIWSTPVKKQHHFGTASGIAERVATVIAAMMNDLCRIVEILDCDVATEEERARVFDRADPHYSILARTLAARRDNLKLTVAAPWATHRGCGWPGCCLRMLSALLKSHGVQTRPRKAVQ
jgi:hypothetical protein